MATDVAATWQYVAQMGAMGATALQTIAGSSWVAGWRVRSAREGGGWAVSGYLRASSQQLLLSQQILQGFITPGTCNTRRSVERMQGSMHSHAGGVWACRRGKWAGGKCRWGRRTTGKSPRMETQNVLTCGARVFVTPVLTPPACPACQDVWL